MNKLKSRKTKVINGLLLLILHKRKLATFPVDKPTPNHHFPSSCNLQWSYMHTMLLIIACLSLYSTIWALSRNIHYAYLKLHVFTKQVVDKQQQQREKFINLFLYYLGHRADLFSLYKYWIVTKQTKSGNELRQKIVNIN